MRYAFTAIAYANSAVNPVLYAGLNENFRQGFKEITIGPKGFCARPNRVTPGKCYITFPAIVMM